LMASCKQERGGLSKNLCGVKAIFGIVSESGWGFRSPHRPNRFGQYFN
jgi:hypothetical protein